MLCLAELHRIIDSAWKVGEHVVALLVVVTEARVEERAVLAGAGDGAFKWVHISAVVD